MKEEGDGGKRKRGKSQMEQSHWQTATGCDCRDASATKLFSCAALVFSLVISAVMVLAIQSSLRRQALANRVAQDFLSFG